MGITIPVTMPKSFNASLSFSPVFISIAGKSMATTEAINEFPARTEVIGRVALNNGLRDFFGLENFPPWKPFCGCKNSFYVIELEGGSLTRSGTEEGDQLSFGNGTENGSTL